MKWKQKANTDNSKTLGAAFMSNIRFKGDKLDSIIPLIKTLITNGNEMGRAPYCKLENSQLESTVGRDTGNINTFSWMFTIKGEG